MLSATGPTGSITFDGRFVTLNRARSSFVDRGSREIPIGQISGIQWKDASLLMSGHLKLLIPGSTERQVGQSGAFKSDILRDPNAIVFGRKHQPAFEKIRAAINQAIIGQQNTGMGGPGVSLADEIAKLQHLAAAGVLSPEEFALAKQRLLAGS
jgi:hypothetical protein